MAEEVAAVDPRLVSWGFAKHDWEEVLSGTEGCAVATHRLKEGATLKPNGVTYDRLSVLLLSLVQRQQTRIEALEARVR